MEKTYLISYDLKTEQESNYENIFKYIKNYGTWAHITESLWAIKTEKTSVEIRDEMLKEMPEGSSLFIVKSGGIAAWSNVLCRNVWLKNNL